MRFIAFLIASLMALTSFGQATQPTTQPTSRTMQLGVVVDANGYYVCPGMWADVAHGFSGWFNCSAYTADSYPLTNGAQAQCNMLGYPAGVYKLSYQGTASIAVKWATASNVSSVGGVTSADITIPKANSTIILTATGLNPADPLRGLHIYAPGYGPTGPVFRAEYTKWLSPFAVIRAMDWACVNVVKTTVSSTTQPSATTWANRVTPTAWDQTSRGTAYEYLLALAAQTNSTAWVNVPYMADDDFCQQLAALCAASGQSIYLELGNENWNAQFGQWLQNQIVAKSSGMTPNQCVADRARKVGLIFRAAMGNRVKVVISGQCVNPIVLSDGLAWIAAKYGDHPFDALAVASYFDGTQAAGATLAQLAANGQAVITGAMTTGLKAHKALADKYGLTFVCYEGGQAYQSWNNPLGSASDFPYVLQTDPMMGQLYGQWLATCQACGVTLQIHDSCVHPWGRSGMFGFAQDLAETPGPKWNTLNSFAALPIAAPVVVTATTQPTTQPTTRPTPITLAPVLLPNGQVITITIQ